MGADSQTVPPEHPKVAEVAKVALVTGASRGIGRACALALASRGLRVAIQYNSGATEAQSVAAEIADTSKAQIFQSNLAQAGAAAALVEAVAAQLGPPTILVHAAGHIVEKPLGFTSQSDWDGLFEVHAFSGAALAKALLRYTRKTDHGRIVFISSLAAVSGLGNGAAYASAKGALEGLTKSLALEAARWKTTVNCVAPGYIATAMTENHDAERRAATIAKIPLGRYGEPSDVAELVAWLCSPAAGFMTGQTLILDGGMSLG